MASVMQSSETPNGKNIPGQPKNVHPAFVWQRSEFIASLNLTVEEYQHWETGAMHYHLASENNENVFLVALRTVPMDSTGVAHILEHTSLCGSKKYPVRDPFFMMIRRSLNTFMNAFTSSDWTAYPFASQNKKDFNNLLDVYLDAVFFARLDEMDFAQEGHRLEFEDIENPESKLLYKGVVFNEMKGALSSPVSVVWEALYKYTYPSTTYHYNSGGEPEYIPDLSYTQLKRFYQSHYHPSNAVFMTYGDIPVSEHHQRIENNALQHFKKLDKIIKVDDEKRYLAPLVVEEFYGIDPDESLENKTHVVFSWLWGKNTDLESLMQAHLLSSVLLDNSASPLRHALETTELGNSPSSLCGLDDSNRELCFMCGLEGANADDADAIEGLVTDTLSKIVNEGIPQQDIEAALHQLELSQREISGDSYPYGLQLILEALPSAIHRGDPVALLNLDPVLDKLRTQIKDPEFIKTLVNDLLVSNVHRVRLTMKPDAQLNQRKEQAEADKLAAIKSTLSQQQAQDLIDKSKALQKRQEQIDDESILPSVGRDDIPATLDIAKGETINTASFRLTRYAQPTNGLVYQQIISALPAIAAEKMPYLSFYTRLLTRLGIADDDYLSVQSRQYQISGGINAFTTIRGGIDDVSKVSGHFVLSGKALTDKYTQFNQLLSDTWAHARFDEYARIKEIIAQQRARAEQSITSNGHALAMLAASSRFSPVANYSHAVNGLLGIQKIKDFDASFSEQAAVEAFASEIAAMHKQVTSGDKQFLLISEAERFATLTESLTGAWTNPASANLGTFELAQKNDCDGQAWLINSQVNFCARAFQAVTMSHEDAAVLSVLSHVLRNGYLHTAIREQGGAYGGGASYDTDNAVFRFYSYRDPRLKDTLADFDASLDWLQSASGLDAKLEEAILGVIGTMDKPGSPAGEAKDAFHNELFGRSPQVRQQFRENVLAVTVADLKRVAELYLQSDAAQQHASTAVVTHKGMQSELDELELKTFELV